MGEGACGMFRFGWLPRSGHLRLRYGRGRYFERAWRYGGVRAGGGRALCLVAFTPGSQRVDPELIEQTGVEASEPIEARPTNADVPARVDPEPSAPTGPVTVPADVLPRV